MKKKETEVKKVSTSKNGKMTLEKLAFMVAQGFGQMQQTMATKSELELVKQSQAKLEQGQEGLREEISALKEDSKDTNRRVVSIERKLSGTLESLDEAVHRSEFDKLERRVKILES